MKLQPGMVLAVNHEPLSFLRRAGHASVDEERLFLEDHSEENIVRLAENGCDIVRFHFFKGFGLQAEREEMEMTREYVRLCHKHGVKVQLYIQFGTLHPETLLAERPEMMDWVQTDGEGRPITLVYGHQNERLYPCFNKPGYWDYLEGVIRMGIEEFGGDAIGFDNITTAEEPSVCHCEACRRAFAGFLKAKYRPDTEEGERRTKERFGHAVLDHILPPRWNYFNHAYNLTDIRNPVAQEWVLFRCDCLHRAMKRVHDFSKSLNPGVFLEYNVYKQFGTNTAFVHGVYLPDYADCLDAFWNECDEPAAFTDEGELHSRIRGYKMARALGKACFTNHPFDGADERKAVSYAESMAFGGGLLSGVDRARGIYSGEQKAFRPFKRFAGEHAEIYGAKPCGAVALYESKASLSFSNYAAWYAGMTMQQCLLRGHIPFDLVFSLEGIEGYRALVLPDAECLSSGEMDSLMRFVTNGGALVITDGTGRYDEWRRAWGDSSLLRRLGFAETQGEGIVEAQAGKGRIIYIKELRSGRAFDESRLLFTAFGTNQPGLGPEFLRAPVNSKEIAAAIRRACAGAIPMETDAPEHVVAELQCDAQSRFCYLHLINYKPDSPAGVRFRANAPGGRGGAVAFLPESGGEFSVEPDAEGWMTLTGLKGYAVVRIPLGAAPFSG